MTQENLINTFTLPIVNRQEELFYQQQDRLYVSVDCIIFGFQDGELSLLLLKRRFEPAKGRWSLMGGFVSREESADVAARRVLCELTGLENVYMEQVGAYGEIGRDPGARVISLAYYALLNIKDYDHELVEKHGAYWVKFNQIPDLIFDHNEMVRQALDILRRKASTDPIGFNLLPDLFTLTQLQQLYEAIYNEPLDKRNFRKSVALMDFIEKTNKIDKITSKRGAALYRFNDRRYKRIAKFKL